MGDYEIKLGAVIKFDSEREIDIIKQIESLTSRHKLGEFISNIIRVAFEHPELIQKNGKTLADYGLTDKRKEFYNGVESDVKKMKDKIDKVYEMALHTYTLAQFGKRMGLEIKASNLLQSQFILQKQLDELCKALGVNKIGGIYESNKMEELSSKVGNILEYIIESYDGIINELTLSLEEKPKVIVESVTSNNGKYSKTPDKVQLNKHNQEDNIEPNKEVESVDDNQEDDQLIDFGSGADWGALNAFIPD